MRQIGNQMSDKNERFVFRRTADLLIRHLDLYPVLDEGILELICWNPGQNREDLGKSLASQFEDENQEEIEESLSESLFDHDEYALDLWRIISKMRQGYHREMIREVKRLLTLKIDKLQYRGKSYLEKNLDVIGEMFDLMEQKREFCKFLFIVSNYDPVEAYFVNHLECHKFSGSRYLCNLLNISKSALNNILTGKLEKIGLFEMDRYDLRLEDDFRPLFENPSSRLISKNFFIRLNHKSIPLGHHFVEEKKIGHTLALLREKPKSWNLFFRSQGVNDADSNLLFGTIIMRIIADWREFIVSGLYPEEMWAIRLFPSGEVFTLIRDEPIILSRMSMPLRDGLLNG